MTFSLDTIIDTGLLKGLSVEEAVKRHPRAFQAFIAEHSYFKPDRATRLYILSEIPPLARILIGEKASFMNSEHHCSPEECHFDHEEDFYPETYTEYNGSYAQDEMGWSDQMIDDVLEGDPDLYWNID